MFNYPKVKKKNGGNFKTVLIIFAVIIGIELFIQIIWPNTILTPNTIIDGNNYGMWDKTKVALLLDNDYSDIPVEIYFGDNTEAHISSTMSEVGLSASNTRRINQINYPAYWRIIPTSLIWYGLLNNFDQPQTITDDLAVNAFLLEKFDDNNYIEPVDAGLLVTEQSIDLKKSQVGGRFSLGELKEAIENPKYENYKAKVTVDIMSENPKVNDEQALKVATTVSGQLVNDLSLVLDEYNEEVLLSVETLRSWISFDVIDGKLMPIINERKLSKYLSNDVAPLVERAAGTTTITTDDLENIERNEGDEGKVLNITETAWRITEYLLGKRQSVAVAVESIDPTVEYVYERINNDDEQEEDENSLINSDELEDLLNPESVI